MREWLWVTQIDGLQIAEIAGVIGERDLDIIGDGDGVDGSTDRLDVGDGVGSIAAAAHCIVVVGGT